MIVRASTGERVALVAGEIDWGWIAELAARAVDVDEAMPPAERVEVPAQPRQMAQR